MNVGDRIKQYRKEKGLTQEQLGDILGVKKAAVQKYENGTVKNLKQETIKRLAETFEVDPREFIDWNQPDVTYNLSNQVELIVEVKNNFGDDAVEVLEGFTLLNDKGRDKLIDYLEDLKKLYEV